VDGLHALPTHDTYFKYLVALGPTCLAGQRRVHDLGNGHAVLEYAAPWGRPIGQVGAAVGEHARDEIATMRADLVASTARRGPPGWPTPTATMLIFPNSW